MSFENKLVKILTGHNLKITAAESCTGGAFIASLVKVAGASAIIDAGIVTYSNESKIKYAAVKPSTIEKFGAVSGQTAAEMASGIRLNNNADIGVAVTGYAGPTGEQVGTIFFAIDFRGKVKTYKKDFGYKSRKKNIDSAVEFITKELINILNIGIPGQSASFNKTSMLSGGKSGVLSLKNESLSSKKFATVPLYKIGALAGKFLPPQIGHAKLIADAAAVSEILYVVLAENPEKTAALCRASGLEPIPATLRLEWLRQHFKNQKNIRYLYMNESGIPQAPDGTQDWSEKFKALISSDIIKHERKGLTEKGSPVGRVTTRIDAKFFGEEAYFEMNEKYFPESKAVLIKRGVDSPEISASEIRSDPSRFLNFVIPPARNYFEKIIKAGKIKK